MARRMKQLKRLSRRFARQFGLARVLCLLLLVGMVALRIADPAPVEELRIRIFDAFQLIEPRIKTIRPVTIVDIDERSLAKFGQWPWSRNQVADMIINLTQLGAVVIAFDIVFSEPDRLNPDAVAETMRYLDEVTREKLRALPSNDQILAEAIKRSRVVLGETGLPKIVSDLDPTLPLTGIASLGADAGPEPFMYEWPGLLRNVRVLEQAAAGRGLISIKTDRDGIIRRVPILMMAQGHPMPSLTLEILRLVTSTPTILVKMEKDGIKSVGVRGLDIPTDLNGRLWIHFADHDPDSFVSASDVLDGNVSPDKIAGKLVLIGTSAAALNDLKTTPVSATMPGVEAHAQVIEAALTRSFLSQPRYGPVVEYGAALWLGVLVIAFTPLLGPITLVLVGALLASALIGLSWYVYSEHRLLIDFTYPLLSTAVIYLTLIFSGFAREQSQRRQIRSAFGQYLSPALVEQLAQSPEKLVLGGEEREMTIMFSDVRGFTTISESYKHDPQGLTALMNRFLTPLTHAILARKGTIDKYMGDAIMAFWNAPLEDPDHQVNACEAALDMLERIKALNREREIEAQQGGQRFIPIEVGVGLNTGLCVVGNMGSDLRFDYSVLGDSVNLASRLEGQSKQYGFPIIAGSRTAMAVKHRFAVLELDFIMVKGKQEPEVIYAVAGRDDTARSENFQRLRDLTIEMLAAYRARDWDGALAAIERGRRSEDGKALDDLYKLYEARMIDFQNSPPPADWNGAFALHTK
jgi:adenylate cyclase